MKMHVSPRRCLVQAPQSPGSVLARGVWRRVPLADAYLFSYIWQAAREGTAMFAGLILVFAIVTGSRLGAEPLAASVWLHALALQTPRVLVFTLPMALLYACVKGFSELSGRGELVALSAAGMGWPRLLRMPLLLGVLAGLGALLLQERVVPKSERARLRVLQSDAQARARSGFEMMSRGKSRAVSGGRLYHSLHAQAADFARGVLKSPVVKELRPDGSLHRQIVAARGKWDDRATAMVFENGWIVELPATLVHVEDTQLLARRFELFTVKDFPSPDRWSQVHTLRDVISDGQFEALSLTELLIERARSLSASGSAESMGGSSTPDPAAQAPALTFAIHDRLAAPLVCLALVLIGCPLGVRAPGTPEISSLGRALMVLLAYFAVWLFASHIGKSGAPFSPLWAYLPFLLLCSAGLELLRRKTY